MGELGKQYRGRIEAMIEALQAHPGVYVAAAKILPPPSAEEIAQAEEFIRRPLPADMRDIYEEFGGLELVWRPVGEDEDREALLASEPDLDDILDESTPFRAVVQLDAPKDWAQEPDPNLIFFDPNDYDELFEDQDQEELEDEHKRLYMLDFYCSWIIVGLTFSPAGEAVVIFGDDYGACYTDHKQASFTTYLDMIIKSWGSSKRAEPLSAVFNWHDKASADELPSPTLDEVVEELLADD